MKILIPVALWCFLIGAGLFFAAIVVEPTIFNYVGFIVGICAAMYCADRLQKLRKRNDNEKT